MINFLDFEIKEFGVEQCISNKKFTYSVKDYELIHFVISGEGIFEFNNKKYLMKKGSLFYIPANSEANYYPRKDNPWQYVWVGFKGLSVKKLLEKSNISARHPVYLVKKDELLKLYHRLFEIHGIINEDRDLLVIATMLEIFYELIGYNEFRNQKMYGAKALVEGAKDFINHNYQFDIKVKDVARDVSITSEYLSKIFNQIEGMSTIDYLIKIRLEVGKNLLLNTNLKINEISKQCGFRSPLYFTNEFKKKYGVSPKEFRKKENI